METERKIYSARSVRIGAFLGGPLAATYFLAENYKALGHPEKVTRTWLTGVVITVLVFGILVALPDATEERVPRFLIPLLTTIAAHLLVKKYQESEIEHFRLQGGGHYSAWRAAGIALLLALITLALVLGVTLGIDLLFGNN